MPAAQRSWWLIVDPQDGVDLCSIDPGFDVDLYVSVDLRTMTAIWMGLDTVRAAVASRRMMLTGEPAARLGDADMARAQSVCKGTEARELTPIHFLNWRAAAISCQVEVKASHGAGLEPGSTSHDCFLDR